MGRIAAIAAAVGLLYLGYRVLSKPRGIRNNNPGNVRHGEDWHGKAAVQPDPDYITFEAPEWGIRAMARTLRTYREKHGLYTIAGIISRWAPPEDDNPTDAYITYVSDRLNASAYIRLSFDDATVADLIAAIIHFENGQQPYSRELLLKGIVLERTS